MLSFFTASSILESTCSVGKRGQVTLESMSALLLLVLAWGQKPQLAEHRPLLYVRRYAVVGKASSLPCIRLSTMAEPTETRIILGTSRVLWFSLRCPNQFPSVHCEISVVNKSVLCYFFASVYWRVLMSQSTLPSSKSFRRDLKTVLDGFPIWSAISVMVNGLFEFFSNETIWSSTLPIWTHSRLTFLFNVSSISN